MGSDILLPTVQPNTTHLHRLSLYQIMVIAAGAVTPYTAVRLLDDPSLEYGTLFGLDLLVVQSSLPVSGAAPRSSCPA